MPHGRSTTPSWWDEALAGCPKDRDFIHLLDEQGPPPQVIWLRLGNCSNAALQEVLSTTLLRAMDHLRDGEPWVEIRPRQASAA